MADHHCLKPGQPLATTAAATQARKLVVDEFAAPFGEDRRTAGETCALLLPALGGESSDAAALRSDGAGDCSLAGSRGLGGGSGHIQANRRRERRSEGCRINRLKKRLLAVLFHLAAAVLSPERGRRRRAVKNVGLTLANGLTLSPASRP